MIANQMIDRETAGRLLLRISKVFYKVFEVKERRGVVWHLVNQLEPEIGKRVTFGELLELRCLKPYKPYAIKLAIIELHECKMLTLGQDAKQKWLPAAITNKTPLVGTPLIAEKLARYCRAFSSEIALPNDAVDLSSEATRQKFARRIYEFFDDTYSAAWKRFLSASGAILSNAPFNIPKRNIDGVFNDGDLWAVLHCFWLLGVFGATNYDFDQINYAVQEQASLIPIPNLQDTLKRMEKIKFVSSAGRGQKTTYCLNDAVRTAFDEYASEVARLMEQLPSLLSKA